MKEKVRKKERNEREKGNEKRINEVWMKRRKYVGR